MRVTGESPIVDVQTHRDKYVLDQETMDGRPVGQEHHDHGGHAAGVSLGKMDPGGLWARGVGHVTAHGNSEVHTLVNGVSVASASGHW